MTTFEALIISGAILTIMSFVITIPFTKKMRKQGVSKKECFSMRAVFGALTFLAMFMGVLAMIVDSPETDLSGENIFLYILSLGICSGMLSLWVMFVAFKCYNIVDR